MDKMEFAWIIHYRREFDGEFLQPNYKAFKLNQVFDSLAETGHFNGKLNPKTSVEEYSKRLNNFCVEVLK